MAGERGVCGGGAPACAATKPASRPISLTMPTPLAQLVACQGKRKWSKGQGVIARSSGDACRKGEAPAPLRAST